jgi:hypothetical protein
MASKKELEQQIKNLENSFMLLNKGFNELYKDQQKHQCEQKEVNEIHNERYGDLQRIVTSLKNCHPKVQQQVNSVTCNGVEYGTFVYEHGHRITSRTERAGEVTFEELAKLVIDGKPLKREKITTTTETIKPICCETPADTKSGIIEETKE